jgi:hypothetical protein
VTSQREHPATPTPSRAGRELAEAVLAQDVPGLLRVLADPIDFRALTPYLEWRATGPEEVAEIFFGSWFEPSDELIELLGVTTEVVGDRHHVGYRLHLRNGDGDLVVEQQAYYDLDEEDRVSWMHVVCSGMRPLVPAAATAA